MVPHGERESICSMLRDTVKILVKNGLTFKYKFNIDGLLGITVDDGDVFLVPMSELVKSDAESQTLELEVEEVDREEHKYTNIRTPVTHRPGQGARKRQLTNTKSSTKQNDSSDEDISEPLSNQSTAVPVGEAIPSKKVCMNNVNDVTDGLPKDITIKREIDEDSWTQENHSYPDQSDHSTDQSLFLDATYSATSATGVYTPAMLENIPGTSSYEYMDDTSSMSTRQKKRTPKGIFTCEECHKTFKYNKNLKEHNMVAHNAERPHCLICGMACLPSNLTRHLAKHTGVNVYGCSGCSLTFTTKGNARRHAQHKCSAKKATIKILKPKAETSQKHKEELKRSMDEFHRKANIGKTKTAKIVKQATFDCPNCHKTYSKNKNLKEHLMSMHGIGEKPICQICGKSFLPSALAAHVATHSEARRRKYTCSICGYAYYRKDAFRRHVQQGACANRAVAKSSIKYTCEICGMSYKLKSSYTKHFKATCARRLEGGDKFFSADRLARVGDEQETGVGDEQDTGVGDEQDTGVGDEQDTGVGNEQDTGDSVLADDQGQQIIVVISEYGTCSAVAGQIENESSLCLQDLTETEILHDNSGEIAIDMDNPYITEEKDDPNAS